MRIFNKILNRGRSTAFPDFSILGTDTHSHLLPTVDDGAKSFDESLTYIRALNSMGFNKLILTPHIKSGVYNNTKTSLQKTFEMLLHQTEEEKLDVELQLAAEYFVDADFLETFQIPDLLTFGQKYFLFELSFLTPPRNLNEIIFELEIAGIKPVLAHPERYAYMNNNFAEYEKLKDRGVLFQSNLLSFTNFYTSAPMKATEKLVDAGFINFLGSDAHNERNIARYPDVLKSKHFGKLIESGEIQNANL